MISSLLKLQIRQPLLSRCQAITKKDAPRRYKLLERIHFVDASDGLALQMRLPLGAIRHHNVYLSILLEDIARGPVLVRQIIYVTRDWLGERGEKKFAPSQSLFGKVRHLSCLRVSIEKFFDRHPSPGLRFCAKRCLGIHLLLAKPQPNAGHEESYNPDLNHKVDRFSVLLRKQPSLQTIDRFDARQSLQAMREQSYKQTRRLDISSYSFLA